MPVPPNTVGESIMFSACLSIHWVRPSVRLFVHLDRSCYHSISWTAWSISMKLAENIHQPLLMTLLHFGGQRSRSQQAIEVVKASTLMRRMCAMVQGALRRTAATVSLRTEKMLSMFRLRNKKCSATGPTRRCSGPEQYQKRFRYDLYSKSWSSLSSVVCQWYI